MEVLPQIDLDSEKPKKVESLHLLDI